MAWTTPLTAVANAALTAAQWNASVRDNLNLTAPALATTASSIFVGSGVNSIAERIPTAAVIAAADTGTSTTYAVFPTPGPTVSSLTSGAKVLVLLSAVMSNSTVNAEAYMSFAVSGATTAAANDLESIRHTSATASAAVGTTYAYITPVTAGSNTYTSQYRVSSGTGSWLSRRLCIIPF